MNLIALRDFRNVAHLKLKKAGKSTVTGAVHDDHIHRGATFAIGDEKDLASLNKADPATAAVVAQLIVAKCVGDADDEKVVAAVKEQVELDKKREESHKRLNENANNSLLVEKILATLTGKTAKA